MERAGTWYYYTALPFITNLGISIRALGPKAVSRLSSPFRRGEGELVRWAQEDMGLVDSEDVMVNGGNGQGLYDLDMERWAGADLDEYIPLTSGGLKSSGRGRQVRSYGATPEVETFAESGHMIGIFRR